MKTTNQVGEVMRNALEKTETATHVFAVVREGDTFAVTKKATRIGSRTVTLVRGVDRLSLAVGYMSNFSRAALAKAENQR